MEKDMAQKTFSVKVEEGKLSALDMLVEQRSTTRNALMVEAIDALLAGGMEKLFEQRLDQCLMEFLGFNTKEGFTEAVEEQFGSMLVDLIDSRVKVLFSIDLSEELQAGSLATLMQLQAQSAKPRPTLTGEHIQKALQDLQAQLGAGTNIVLDDLAKNLDIDKGVLAKALSDRGVKTQRKRIGGGEKRQFYTVDSLEAVNKALEA